MDAINSYKLKLLLYFIFLYSITNIVYQFLTFTDFVDGTVQAVDIVESLLDLLSKISILAGLLIKTKKGWIFSYSVSVFSIVYIILVTLLFNNQIWIYLYLFTVTYVFSLLLQLLTSLAIRSNYVTKPYLILYLSLLYKFFYCVGITFLCMYTLNHMFFSVFVSTILFFFLVKNNDKI